MMLLKCEVRVVVYEKKAKNRMGRRKREKPIAKNDRKATIRTDAVVSGIVVKLFFLFFSWKRKKESECPYFSAVTVVFIPTTLRTC